MPGGVWPGPSDARCARVSVSTASGRAGFGRSLPIRPPRPDTDRILVEVAAAGVVAEGMPHAWDTQSPSPDESLARLVDGNRRFLERTGDPAGRPWRQDLGDEAQRPFAIILGCSDSRTPVEILFDQGFGDLFVVRIAGNIVAPSGVGSIEFATSQFGPRLVVVLGHSRCGAIAATVRAIETGDGPESKNIRSITDRIMPHIEALVRPAKDGADREVLLREATRANIRASVDHLRHGSRMLEELVLGGQVVVVGAEYDLATGQVLFLDEHTAKPGAR
jgi:carbonic anhydrase